jgi:hypothetical protein
MPSILPTVGNPLRGLACGIGRELMNTKNSTAAKNIFRQFRSE